MKTVPIDAAGNFCREIDKGDPRRKIGRFMAWLDSSPVKLVNFIASIAAIVGLIAGGALGNEVKGPEWGALAAIAVGGVLGLMAVSVFYSILILVLFQFRRNCPHCRGTGWAVDEHFGNEVFTRACCQVCGGRGKVW